MLHQQSYEKPDIVQVKFATSMKYKYDRATKPVSAAVLC